MAKSRPNSMAMNSAHPILRPFLSHSGCNLHASHLFPSIVPIPQDDEASTQNSTGETIGGFDREEPQKITDSWVRHQVMSVRTAGLGDLRTNDEENLLKEEEKREIEGNRERPLGIAKEQ